MSTLGDELEPEFGDAVTQPGGRQLDFPRLAKIEIKTAKRLRSDLRLSHLDAFSFGSMTGFGETYLPAFALAVGTGEAIAGLLASVPIFVGGLVQLLSPKLIGRFRSKKTWVVACAFIQAASFLPLMVMAVAKEVGTFWLFACVSLYWAAGMSGTPAWNFWVGRMIPERTKPAFFARRTQWLKIGLFVGLLFGGLLLRLGESEGQVGIAFIVVFMLAAMSRLMSVACMYRQSEVLERIHYNSQRHQGIGLKEAATLKSWPILIYLVLMQAAVQFAGPFFTPFMIGQLGFGYGAFVTILTASFVTKFLMLSVWGRFARKYGIQKLLVISGIAITPLSAAWLISQNFCWLIFVQILSGIAWAAYELAFVLIFLSCIPDSHRVGLTSIFNFMSSTAWCVGALLGAGLLHGLGESTTAYFAVFVVSAILRLLCLPILLRLPQLQVARGSKNVSVRSINVRPNSASFIAILPCQESKKQSSMYGGKNSCKT